MGEVTITEMVKFIFFLVGLALILHYMAYSIGWGFKKGWSKVDSDVNVILNNPQDK